MQLRKKILISKQIKCVNKFIIENKKKMRHHLSSIISLLPIKTIHTLLFHLYVQMFNAQTKYHEFKLFLAFK